MKSRRLWPGRVVSIPGPPIREIVASVADGAGVNVIRAHYQNSQANLFPPPSGHIKVLLMEMGVVSFCMRTLGSSDRQVPSRLVALLHPDWPLLMS